LALPLMDLCGSFSGPWGQEIRLRRHRVRCRQPLFRCCKRQSFQRCCCAAAIRALPAVLGPVQRPPWFRQRPFGWVRGVCACRQDNRM